MTTPEELAEEFADDRYCPFGERERWEDAKTGYLAGYKAKEEEIVKIHQEIAELKAHLMEMENDNEW